MIPLGYLNVVSSMLNQNLMALSLKKVYLAIIILLCRNCCKLIHFFKGFDRGKDDASQNKDDSSQSMSKSKVSAITVSLFTLPIRCIYSF